MELQVASPFEKKTFSVAWVEIDTEAGNFIIQPEHVPMVVELKKYSVVVYRLISGKQNTLKIDKGIAHITRDSVTLLLNE